MKKLLIVGALLFVGVAGWRIGGTLNSDAIGMAVGMLFGVMAGIPTALVVIAAGRDRPAESGLERPRSRHTQQQVSGYGYQPQPPVIVVTSGTQQQLPQSGMNDGFGQLPQPDHIELRPERQYKVVGEHEEWL